MRVRRSAVNLLASIGFCLLAVSAKATDEIGDVIYPEYNGALGYQATGQQHELRPQEPVFKDERVVTGSQAATSIRFLDKTVLDVGSNSDVVLDELIFNPDNTGSGVLNLTTGAFRIVSGAMPDGAMTITTPTVTIGIRGTEIVIFILKDGTTEVNLIHGALTNRVCESADAIPLAAGQQLLVSSDCQVAIGVARAVPTGIPQMPDDLAALEGVTPAAGGTVSASSAPPRDERDHGSPN
ncbi:MAG: FecR domain-containing protein [Aestuariivirga sp.]